MMIPDYILQGIVILLATIVLMYLVYDYMKRKNAKNEPFEDFEELETDEAEGETNEGPVSVTQHTESRPTPVNNLEENKKNKADSNSEKYPRDCFPKDKLTPEDLLPKDAANSQWAQVNPAGQGDMKNQNFLTAGYHVGINTTGSTLRNPNLQLRSEPPNPQQKVSPWMQTTIEPDLNRLPLEINGN
jgi:hypothetical protein